MTEKQTDAPKIVIIGGVAGGASAAAKARRVNEFAEIIILEKGPYVSYANCGLPYHISGEIEKRSELFVTTPKRLKVRFGIDVRVRHEVTAIDRTQKTVSVMDHSKGTHYSETYDKLIISTGAEPIVPPLPGIDSEGIFCLKTVEDMDRVIEYVNREKPESAVVVGGGFIGLEAADALHLRNLEVSIVEAADQLLLPWDPEFADPIEQHLFEKMFVEVYKDDPVSEFISDNGQVTGVKTKGGEEIDAGLVILSIGVKPLSSLAADAGLELTERGLIITDDHMRTSDPDIFAAGDAVQSNHRVTGKPAWLPMAGPANRQGRTAGINAAGGNEFFPGVIGTSIVRVGKLTAARTGINEKEARLAKIDHFTTTIGGDSHAGYFPGARDIMIKFVVKSKTGRLLGAQAVGRDGVDKRIDVLATAIIARMAVRDIVDLELAYSPPYGSAKDPVNMAAMVAQNQLDGITEVITWEELFTQEKSPVIIDVRSAGERKTVYVKGTEHIPLDTLRKQMKQLDVNAPIRVYCRIGQRGYFAEQILKAHGFTNVKNIAGGWRSIWGEYFEDHVMGQEPEPAD
jgi:NADPH-dependent 2,4-dienoyl-CoA reductase/sulfur reductase-like enzyme/rhodanese-related sulfurtransferase